MYGGEQTGLLESLLLVPYNTLFSIQEKFVLGERSREFDSSVFKCIWRTVLK